MLKKLLSISLVLTMLFTVFSFPASALFVGMFDVDSQSGVTAVKFTTSNAKIVGRTSEANPFLFVNHASGVEFTVTGTSTVGVRMSGYDSDLEGRTNTEVPFYITIDGQDVTTNGADYTETYDYKSDQVYVDWLSNNPQPEKNAFVTKAREGFRDYILATDLDINTTHTVKITIDKENWGNYWRTAVEITHALVGEGGVINKAAEADRKILVFGDSITSANNIGGIHGSYHQLTAKAFGAETQVVSACGGLFYDKYKRTGADGEDPEEINQISISTDWNKMAWNKNIRPEGSNSTAYETPAEFADTNNDGEVDLYETSAPATRYVPDLVILSIGTNDNKYLFTTTQGDYREENQATFTTLFNGFMDDMREYYPKAKIIVAYGLMTHEQALIAFYNTLVNNYRSTNNLTDKDLRFLEFTKTPNYFGSGDTHPDKYGHQDGAKELIAEIEDMLGWETGAYVYPNNENVVETLPKIKCDENSLPLGFSNGSVFVKLNDTLNGRTFLKENVITLAQGALNGIVDENGNKNEPITSVDPTAKYLNGFYLQGAQVRIPVEAENIISGLRFVVVNNTEIKEALGNEFSFERGVVVVAGTKFDGSKDLVIGTEFSKKVVAEYTFVEKTQTGKDYDKYTVCVTNISEEHFKDKIHVRPYFKYTDKSGIEHVYYGEQYSSTLYDMAALAYQNETDLNTRNWLYNEIISKYQGDNDGELKFD